MRRALGKTRRMWEGREEVQVDGVDGVEGAASTSQARRSRKPAAAGSDDVPETVAGADLDDTTGSSI